jgi:hypothetical protein
MANIEPSSTKIQIIDPLNNISVELHQNIEGKLTAQEATGKKVWIVVYVELNHMYYIQPSMNINSDGTFRGSIYIGDENTPPNTQFKIRAIVNSEEVLFEGKKLDHWPKAQWSSEIISVFRKKQQKILILAAIPNGLRLDKEIREIEDAIRRSRGRNKFEIREQQAVRPKDIRRAIAEEKPQIIHFCGHGSADGSLILEDEAGELKPVTPDGLAELFKINANYVNCVLLNVCHSEKLVEAISQYINYVIGMNQAVKDRTTMEFAIGFYDALGYDNPDTEDKFQRAFQEGILAIKLAGLPGDGIPFIKKKTKTTNDIL